MGREANGQVLSLCSFTTVNPEQGYFLERMDGKINTAVEYIRLTVTVNDLAIKYKEAIYKLDKTLNDTIESIPEEPSDDVSDDDNLAFSKVGTFASPKTNIGGIIEVF